MTDPADRHLEERLHALARGVSVPVVPADADVRRGRRRLLRMRVAMAGATTGTLAVVLGITGLTAGDPSASEPPFVEQPSTSLPTDPTPSQADEAEGSTEDEQGDLSANGGGQQQPPVTDPSRSVDAEGQTGRVPGLAGAGDATTGAGHPDAGATTEPEPLPTASDPTSVPTTAAPTSAPSSTSDPTIQPTSDPTVDPEVPPTETGEVRVHQVLRYYNVVLAEHLDPARDHLQRYSRKADDKQMTRRGGQLFELGSTYRWEDGDSTGRARPHRGQRVGPARVGVRGVRHRVGLSHARVAGLARRGGRPRRRRPGGGGACRRPGGRAHGRSDLRLRRVRPRRRRG